MILCVIKMCLQRLFIAGLIVLIIGVAMKFFRSKIYDIMIVSLTSQWYREVLALLDNNTTILDVGIGMKILLHSSHLTID